MDSGNQNDKNKEETSVWQALAVYYAVTSVAQNCQACHLMTGLGRELRLALGDNRWREKATTKQDSKKDTSKRSNDSREARKSNKGTIADERTVH